MPPDVILPDKITFIEQSPQLIQIDHKEEPVEIKKVVEEKVKKLKKKETKKKLEVKNEKNKGTKTNKSE